jgi:hypothetical protein
LAAGRRDSGIDNEYCKGNLAKQQIAGNILKQYKMFQDIPMLSLREIVSIFREWMSTREAKRWRQVKTGI